MYELGNFTLSCIGEMEYVQVLFKFEEGLGGTTEFVYLEPDPQHLCDMNPASLEMHNYWCYNEFQCLQWMSFDTPIFVLDLEQS